MRTLFTLGLAAASLATPLAASAATPTSASEIRILSAAEIDARPLRTHLGKSAGKAPVRGIDTDGRRIPLRVQLDANEQPRLVCDEDHPAGGRQ